MDGNGKVITKLLLQFLLFLFINSSFLLSQEEEEEEENIQITHKLSPVS